MSAEALEAPAPLMLTTASRIPPPLRPREPLSPFVAWSPADRRIPDALLGGEPTPSLLVELLRDPEAIVGRILDPARQLTLVVGAIGAAAAGTAFFTATMAAARHLGVLWLPSLVAAFDFLLAVGAALGPIYATGLLVSARLPLARLIAAMLAATATGALLLGGLAPAVYALWQLDREWYGPLGFVAAFAFAGLAGGARLHELLTLLALRISRETRGDPSAVLSGEDAFRVGILARVAMMTLAFTLSLALWAFDAFGVR